jgi:hypothetical protein
LRSFRYAGHCRDSVPEASMTEVDWPRELVRVYPWARAGVFRRVCQRLFGIVCTIRAWLGDVASCRGRCGLASSAWVPSLWICLASTWSFTPPCGLAWRGFGHSPRLADLLDGDLVVRPASQTCSAGAWLVKGQRCLWASPWVPRSWVPDMMNLGCLSGRRSSGMMQHGVWLLERCSNKETVGLVR